MSAPDFRSFLSIVLAFDAVTAPLVALTGVSAHTLFQELDPLPLGAPAL